MKEITLIVFAILACSVCSLEDKFKKDKLIFNAFQDEIYGSSFDMELFIDLIWPKMKRIVPKTVSLPAVEILGISTDFYMCATNFTVQAKVGTTLSKKVILNSKEKITFEVEAELFLDEKPVEFGIAKKLEHDKASPIIPVMYAFKEPCRVKFVLEIPNFLGKRKILNPMCITRVKNIMVVSMKNPEPEMEIHGEMAMEVVDDFERNFSDGIVLPAKVLGTVGLVKAVNEGLHANAGFWICSSNYFDSVAEGYKKEWEYSPNYNKYCLKEGKDDKTSSSSKNV